MYTPSQTVLKKYADLLVKFALNSGEGVRPGEVVQLTVPDVAKPLFAELLRATLEAGAYPKITFIPTLTDKIFFENANASQIAFFPEAYKRAEADLIDHSVSIVSDPDPQELKGIPPDKVFAAMDARRKFRDWLFVKEQEGKYTWTLAMYGTEAMAREAGMSIEEYWDVIIDACYLDTPDPVKEWRRIQKEQDRIKAALNALAIEWVHVEADGIDLRVQLGKNRIWLGGSCRNIPSYELFISPNWRGTEGTVAFNQPLYRYGNILRDIQLTFKNGLVVSAKASQGQDVLDSMLRRTNAKKIGEFSLTDKRFSRIRRFMANTLFDENIGGDYGNTHIALGRAYKDSYPGDQSEPTDKEWDDWGFNDSPEHTDIISTTDRTVTATCGDGRKVVIFKDGSFTV